MYVSDALSRIYSEKHYKITDIIPLNFPQHLDDEFIYTMHTPVLYS